MYFTDKLIDGNSPLKKLSSIIYGISVIPSLRNLLIDYKWTKHAKKIYLLHSVRIFIDKFNISLTRELYVMPSMFFLSIGISIGKYNISPT